MKKRKLLKKIESLKRMVETHKRKIEKEKHKSYPDAGCIAHWKKEIVNFRSQMEKVMGKGKR